MTTGPKPKKTAKSKEAGPQNAKVPGVTIGAKELIVAHGAWMRTDDLIGKLTSEGYKVSKESITTLQTDFRQSLRVLDSLGKVEGPHDRAAEGRRLVPNRPTVTGSTIGTVGLT